MSARGRGAATGLACAAGVATTLATVPARAVEREHHLGADAGMVIEDSDSPDVGLSLGAHWTYGIDDAWNVMAEGDWTFVARGSSPSVVLPGNRAASIANVDAGVAYVLDVLQWVPYAGVMAGADGLTGGTVKGLKIFPDVVLAAGLDYRVGRSLAVGVAIREHMLVTEFSTYPSFTQILGRVEYTWGW